MPDATVRRLKDRLARLQGELARLQTQIEAYRRVIADLEQEDDPNRGSTPAKLLVNHMWKILEDAGRPMHYREIYQALLDRGVEIPGQDPLKNVGAHLSADHRFEKMGKGLWALRSWRETNRPGKPPSPILQAVNPGQGQSAAEEEQEDGANPLFDAILTTPLRGRWGVSEPASRVGT